MQPNEQVQQIHVRINDEIAGGVYSNAMEVKHTKEEFCLDFLNIFPPVGALTARVIISPGHLKRIIRALNENMAKYESKFGRIEAAQDPKENTFGFAE